LDIHCGTNVCVTQKCSDFTCSWHGCCSFEGTPKPDLEARDFVKELLTYQEHPFVEDLIEHFGTTSMRKLTAEVAYFVGRNGYDESALPPD
jgi:hypothetical protein